MVDEFNEGHFAENVEEVHSVKGMLGINYDKDKIRFLADSGASEHLINEFRSLFEIEKVEKWTKIKGTNKNSDTDLEIETKGVIETKDTKQRILKLKDILFNQNITLNLFSLCKIVNKGGKVELTRDKIFIWNKNDELLKTGRYDGKFWWLNFDLVQIVSTPKIKTADNIGKGISNRS